MDQRGCSKKLFGRENYGTVARFEPGSPFESNALINPCLPGNLMSKKASIIDFEMIWLINR